MPKAEPHSIHYTFTTFYQMHLKLQSKAYNKNIIVTTVAYYTKELCSTYIYIVIWLSLVLTWSKMDIDYFLREFNFIFFVNLAFSLKIFVLNDYDFPILTGIIINFYERFEK